MDIDLPQGWEEAARCIAEEKPRRILVLGDVDVGKSTFINYLLRTLLGEGLTCSLIDADIGQKDLGPPATVTLGEFQYLYELRLGKVRAMYFVGSTSPRGHLLPLLVGTKLLADKAQGTVAVVNTTGFVKNAGFALKGFKIELLKPELLIALQRDAELEPLLRSYAHVHCLRLPVSAMAKSKSFEERRALRREAFRRYFSSAVERRLEVEAVRFQRVSAHNEEGEVEDAIGRLKHNLLIGLANEEGEVLGLGIVKGFDGRTLSIITPVKDEIAVVQLGSMLVRENGEELGFVRR
jgi:polynucleotide 5'-hydroxyl-kinase GRC3/NOL9